MAKNSGQFKKGQHWREHVVFREKDWLTAERQAFYASQEWKSVCSEVWKRDKATCQRCGLVRDTDLGIPFHIHHVTSFAVKALRAEASNLLLVCEPCHQWIHSRRNVNREYLQEI